MGLGSKYIRAIRIIFTRGFVTRKSDFVESLGPMTPSADRKQDFIFEVVNSRRRGFTQAEYEKQQIEFSHDPLNSFLTKGWDASYVELPEKDL